MLNPFQTLSQFTSAESEFLSELAGLAYVAGDILYYDGSQLQRLPIGGAGEFLGITAGIPDWTSLPGGGDVSKVGTPVDNQVGVWTGDGTIEGNVGLTFDGTTLTTIDLQVDNVNINGNTISSTAGTDLLITPLAGQQLILDGTIIIDAGVVEGITSLGVTGNRVTAGFFIDLTVTNAIAASITGNAATVTVADAGGDTTTFPLLGTSATGSLAPATDAGFIYNATANRIGVVGGAEFGTAVTTVGADATLDVFGTTNAVIHGHCVGAQGATGGAAIIAYALPTGAAILSGSRLSAFIGGGSVDVSNTLANATAITSFATENWSGAQNGANLKIEVTANGATTRSVAVTVNPDSSVFFANTIELGHATANTLSASGAVLSIEGTAIPKGTGTANEIAYWSGTNVVGALAVATYPSLTELSYVKGVTSAIQTQLGTKAPTTSPTFATSITGSYLTASEILITDGSKNIVSAAVATYPSLTELSYVKGLSSAVQTQLNARLPLTGGTMSGAITLGENASIALDPAGSADGKYTGTTVTGTAGAALSFGDLIYLDPTDSRWELADANAAAAADGDSRGILGICVLAAAGDGSATTVLLQGIVRADTAFPALTIGAPVYVSETAGDIVVTQPTTADVVIRIVGIAITSDEIFFNPDNTWTTHT